MGNYWPRGYGIDWGTFLLRKSSHKQKFLENLKHTQESFLPPGGWELAASLSDKQCQKNPGHTGFIAIKSFRKEYLPCDWQQDLMYEWIKVEANLIVRIQSGYTSRKRPEHLLLPDMVRGSRTGPFGTGCLCFEPECVDSENGCYEFRIKTAHHIIYDDEEASMAKVDFYFDDEGDSKLVVSLPGSRVMRQSAEEDWSVLTCVTHDRDLYERVKGDYEKALTLRAKVCEEQNNSLDLDCPLYSFIISHPHGQAKNVSFGDRCDEMLGLDDCHDSYNTPTCPGSSGAPVFMDVYPSLSDTYARHGTHHGRNRACEGFNRTGGRSWYFANELAALRE